MQAAFLASEEYHERWKVKTREIMTEFEWRKRRLSIRLKEEEERICIAEKARGPPFGWLFSLWPSLWLPLFPLALPLVGSFPPLPAPPPLGRFGARGL